LNDENQGNVLQLKWLHTKLLSIKQSINQSQGGHGGLASPSSDICQSK